VRSETDREDIRIRDRYSVLGMRLGVLARKYFLNGGGAIHLRTLLKYEHQIEIMIALASKQLQTDTAVAQPEVGKKSKAKFRSIHHASEIVPGKYQRCHVLNHAIPSALRIASADFTPAAGKDADQFR